MRSPRHELGQAAEPVDLAGVDGMDHRAGAEKQQRLEEGVIPDVQQAPLSPRTTQSAVPSDRPSRARPRPITMMPMFSMLW